MKPTRRTGPRPGSLPPANGRMNCSPGCASRKAGPRRRRGTPRPRMMTSRSCCKRSRACAPARPRRRPEPMFPSPPMRCRRATGTRWSWRATAMGRRRCPSFSGATTRAWCGSRALRRCGAAFCCAKSRSWRPTIRPPRRRCASGATRPGNGCSPAAPISIRRGILPRSTVRWAMTPARWRRSINSRPTIRDAPSSRPGVSCNCSWTHSVTRRRPR